MNPRQLWYQVGNHNMLKGQSKYVPIVFGENN